MTHLWLMPTKPIEALPIPAPSADCLAFHSDDPEQLAQWLREGRGPTCSNDAQILEDVQRLIDTL